MAWNSTNNKSLNSADVKALGPGAPIATNPTYAGKAYKDGWDIERAYKEGMQKITWVARCIDAIAGNQARLPIILRKDNSPNGEILTGRRADRESLLEILNTKSNIGENSFIFRYRLSSQLLLGTRGVFIEKIRGRDGSIVGLSLLPPQSTSPIPDPKTFVSGYEVQMPYGQTIIMKPDDVCWIRRPHPIDPYLSLTPLESCGVALEIENLAKLYNRNYLMNDGRPGGLLVLKGEIDDEDKDELRSRFRGNISKTGYTSVISSEDGVDYIDTSASPRDAAYLQMRQITKEEILASFGVPESVIGNASGRTFSNASEEIRVFWMETMMPHLEPLARGLDELDEKHYIDFDLSEVPILQLYKQERERYLLQEFQTGLISNNEYRTGSGRKETESDLADSLLLNPNLIPISNTKKKMEEQPKADIPPGGAPGMPPMPGAPPMPPGEPPMPGMPPAPGEPPLDPNTMAGALAQSTIPPDAMGASTTTEAPVPAGAASEPNSGLMYKSEEEVISQTISRWEEILDRSLERVLERQERVVLEKAGSSRARKGLFSGTLDVDSIISLDTWNKQMDDDIQPVLSAIIQDSIATKLGNKTTSKSLKQKKNTHQSDIRAQIESQMNRIKAINKENIQTTYNTMLACLNVAGEEDRAIEFRKSLVAMYANLTAKQLFEISEDETRRAWNFGQQLQ